ncbi:MAG: hypothetical protein GY868_18345, partial [Deltaproteobacteria bacterium]|nr:hypothetical protein [Deltaproteobacteria bacterium]
MKRLRLYGLLPFFLASLMLHAALVAVAPAGFFERPVKKNREVFDVELVAPKPRLRPKSPRP